MRVIEAVKETIADVSSVSPSSERMTGLEEEEDYETIIFKIGTLSPAGMNERFSFS